MCVCVYVCMYVYVYIYICVYIYTAGDAGGAPTCSIVIHAYLGRSHKNTNHVFRLVNPVLDRYMYILKITVFMKRAEYE